jgi:YD repeat-containing protein
MLDMGFEANYACWMKKYLLTAAGLIFAIFFWHRSNSKNDEPVSRLVRPNHAKAAVIQPAKVGMSDFSSSTVAPQVAPPAETESNTLATTDTEKKKLKREIRKAEEYAEAAGGAKFTVSRELSRTQLPDGRTTIEYDLGEPGNIWKMKQMVLPGGGIAAEQILTSEGEEINRMYASDGSLAEVKYLLKNRNAYSITYDENGQIAERTARIGQSVYSTQDGSWQKLFEQ